MECKTTLNDESAPATFFDIIGNLSDGCVYPVLDRIFVFLDAKSLLSCGLVSKTWKAAFSGMNTHKHWKVLLQQKFITSPHLKVIHRNMVANLNSKILPDYRKHFSKIRYLSESLRKNWIYQDYSREHFHFSVVNGQKLVHQTNEQTIGFYDSVNKSFLILDRPSLKVKDDYQVSSPLPEEAINDDNCKIVYELYEDEWIIYTSNSGKIIFRNVVTKQTNVHNPFAGMDFQFINYLRAQNGYFCVSVKTKDQITRHSDIYIWKFDSLTNIEWKNFKKLSSLAEMDKSEVHMNDKFIVIQIQNENEEVFEIYSMAKPFKRKGIIKCSVLDEELRNVSYYDGFIIEILENNCFNVIDVETGVSRTVTPAGIDYPKYGVFLTVAPGFIFVSAFVGSITRPVFSIVIWSWKFNDVINPNINTPLQPLSFFKAYVRKPMHFYVNPLSIVTLYQHRSLNRFVVRSLNFLPTCNFCNAIRENLRRCCRCKSAKYCNRACQTSDWHHHKKLCREVREMEP